MSRIYFFGDLHGHFQHVVELVQEEHPDAVILLGDLEPNRPLEVELASILSHTIVRFIHGNHDSDTARSFLHVFGSRLDMWNLHGRVEEICGVRIAGLGGAFRGKIWMPPDKARWHSYAEFVSSLNAQRPKRVQKELIDSMGKKERLHSSSNFPEDFHRLLGENADILVTHEAPSCHPYGFDEIDSLARSLGVSHVFHGHHHENIEYAGTQEKLGFQVHGVALRKHIKLEV